MEQELLNQLKKTITDVKDTITNKAEESAERQEVIEKAVDDVKMRIDAIEAASQRKSSYIEELETPQVQHILKNYGKVPFQSLLTKTSPYKGDFALQNLQEKSDYVYLLGYVKYRNMINQGTISPQQVTLRDVITSTRLYKSFDEETMALRKALSTGGTGTGSEFVPTGFTADLQDRVILTLRVAALHRRIPMSRNPFDLPVRVSTKPLGFKVSERTTDNILTEANRLPALSLGTRKVTFDAVGLGALVVFSTEQEEDSIVPMLPFVRDEIVMSIGNAQETAVLNGSTLATHPDNDTQTGANKATDPATAWDGYRELATKPSTDTKQDLSTFNETNLRALRGLMGKYGAAPSELAWVTSIKVVLNKMLNLSQVITVDKFGAMATVLNGQLAAFDGIPVIVSEYSRDDVHTTGFNTSGQSNNKSVVVCVHRPSLVFGDMRDIRVIDMNWPLSDQVVVVSKARMDFEVLHDPTTELISALGHNV
jgi:HK97 family phage major capsid protein